MEKTKLGLSVSLVGAIIFLAALFGGYTPLLLVAGYVLIVEESTQLKKTAVTACLLAIAFSLLSFLIGLIPELLSVLISLLQIFGVYDLHFSFINNVTNFLYTALSVIKEVTFVFLAGLAALGKPFIPAFVSKIID